jgi:GT2 family glycosyltransferase
MKKQFDKIEMTETPNDSLPEDRSLPNFCEKSINPIISVIIVNYNGKKFLKECLDSLYDQTAVNLEIIVVDNASSDSSVDYLKSCFSEVILIENSSNLGFAGGVNTGIRNACGAFILTLNNDTWVDCHCIERLLAAMKSDNCIGMCATKMLFPDYRINSAGICISRSGAAWDRGMYEEDTSQYNICEEIFGPCAGAALLRKAMLDEIGLFDEDFFLYMEDVDLAFRGQLAGWKCIYVPDAVVYHHRGGTAGVLSDTAVYYGNRNIIWYPVKNYPILTLLISLPWIIGRNIGVIPYYAVQRKGHVVIQSKIDGIQGLPRMLKKRKNISQTVSSGRINRLFKLQITKNKGLHVDH